MWCVVWGDVARPAVSLLGLLCRSLRWLWIGVFSAPTDLARVGWDAGLHFACGLLVSWQILAESFAGGCRAWENSWGSLARCSRRVGNILASALA